MQLHVGLLDSRAINHCKGRTEVSSPDDSSWTIRTRMILDLRDNSWLGRGWILDR